VFDLMGADPRIDDARWLLDWIGRTNRTQFSRRDAHRAAPRGRFAKATDLEPALRLLEEHGYLRRVDPEPSRDPHGRGRPASPRFLVNPLATRHRNDRNNKNNLRIRFCCFCRFCGAWRELGRPPMRVNSPVTLSNENALSRFRPCQESCPAASARERPAYAPRQVIAPPTGPWLLTLRERRF
jgi:hypothetical protein